MWTPAFAGATTNAGSTKNEFDPWPVIASPSEQWGETPLAFVVLASRSTIDAEVLRQWVNSQLGKAQRISRIEFIDELPRSPIGKVLKRKLRDGIL